MDKSIKLKEVRQDKKAVSFNFKEEVEQNNGAIPSS